MRNQEQETAMYDQPDEDEYNVNLCASCRNPDLEDILDVTHCELCGERI